MATAPVLYTLLLAKQEIEASKTKITALESEVANLKDLVDSTPETVEVNSITLSDEAASVNAVISFDADKNLIVTMGDQVTSLMKVNGDFMAAGNVGGQIVLEAEAPEAT